MKFKIFSYILSVAFLFEDFLEFLHAVDAVVMVTAAIMIKAFFSDVFIILWLFFFTKCAQ